jgi:hypothetical protein
MPYPFYIQYKYIGLGTFCQVEIFINVAWTLKNGCKVGKKAVPVPVGDYSQACAYCADILSASFSLHPPTLLMMLQSVLPQFYGAEQITAVTAGISVPALTFLVIFQPPTDIRLKIVWVSKC